MINHVTLIGNLASDPTTVAPNSAHPGTRFRMITNRSWVNKKGDKIEEATGHNIVVWGGQAKACRDFLTKGRQVYVEGRISNRQFEQDGETRYYSEIVAENVRFLGNKKQD